jgi:protoheme IX farnesyltransferase
MLPSNPGRDKRTALQTFAYSLVLIPVGILPYHLGISGITSAIVAIVSGVILCYYAWMLIKKCDNAAAKKLMFASFIYLPVVQLAFYLDKI